MAGQKPTFITGANAKVQVAGVTFAYASDVSYQVSIDTIPVETMGRYEAVTNEPVNYSVSGSLTVVRYTNLATTNQVPKVKSGGNGLGNVANGTGGKLSDQMNPSGIMLSQTWDLAVFQKQDTSTDHEVIKIMDCRFNSKSATLSKRGLLVDRFSFVGVIVQDDSFQAGYSADADLQP
jgi:hypothetical protein